MKIWPKIHLPRTLEKIYNALIYYPGNISIVSLMVSCGFPLQEDCTFLMGVSVTVLGNDIIRYSFLSKTKKKEEVIKCAMTPTL